MDLDTELVDELRNAVVYAQHHGQPAVTQVGIIERGIRIALDEFLQTTGLKQFPNRGGLAPKPGRRPE